MFPPLGYHESQCCKHGYANIFLRPCFQLGKYSKMTQKWDNWVTYASMFNLGGGSAAILFCTTAACVVLCQPCTTPQPAWLPNTVAEMPYLITEFLPAIFIINTDAGHPLWGNLFGDTPAWGLPVRGSSKAALWRVHTMPR